MAYKSILTEEQKKKNTGYVSILGNKKPEPLVTKVETKQEVKPEPKKSLLSRANTFAKDIYVDRAKTWSAPLVSLVNAGRNIVSLAKGPNASGKYTDYSNKSYNIPTVGEVKPAFTGDETLGGITKKVIGYGADIASDLMIGGGLSKGAKIILKSSGKEGFKTLLKSEVKLGLKTGIAQGAAYGTGRALQEDKKLGEVIFSGLTSAAAGGITGAALGVAAPFIGKLLPKRIAKEVESGTLKVEDALQSEKITVGDGFIMKDGAQVATISPKGELKLLPQPQKLLPSGRELKPKMQGDGFTMSATPDSSALAVSKATQKYQTALTKYNQVPTLKNFEEVLKLKAKVESAQPIVLSKTETPPVVQPVVNSPVPQVAQEIRPTIEPISSGNKTSGVAIDIEARLKKSGMMPKYENLPTYESSDFAEQALKTSKLMENIDNVKAVLKGEQPLDGKVGPLIDAVEKYLKTNPDQDLQDALINSPLLSKVSENASELSFMRAIEKDSPTMRIKNIKNIKSERINSRVNVEGVKSNLNKESLSVNLSEVELKISKFLEDIAC